MKLVGKEFIKHSLQFIMNNKISFSKNLLKSQLTFSVIQNGNTRGYPEIRGQIEYLIHALSYFYENFLS